MVSARLTATVGERTGHLLTLADSYAQFLKFFDDQQLQRQKNRCLSVILAAQRLRTGALHLATEEQRLSGGWLGKGGLHFSKWI